jgi:hypothetical protein
MRASFPWLLAMALASLARAQAAGERRPTFARVVDAAGQAVAGADVVFAGGSFDVSAQVCQPDVQVVASDARGRVQARLRPGLCYVAFALTPAREGGARERSAVAGPFGAGAMLELRCVEPCRDQRLRIAGAEAWRDLGPLRWFVTTPVPGAERELDVDETESVLVPPWPLHFVEARTARGEPLWGAHQPAALALPPPQSVRVRVVDGVGAPIASARLRQRVVRRGAWRFEGSYGVPFDQERELGTTAPDGRATVVVPYVSDPLRQPGAEDLWLFAEADGRAPVVGGVIGGFVCANGRRVRSFRGDELAFALEPVPPLASRVAHAGSAAVAQLVAVCKVFTDRTSYLSDQRVFTAPVGADGTVTFASVPADVHSVRLALLPGSGNGGVRYPAFPARLGRELPPELAIDERSVLRVRCRDFGGGPAAGVVGFLVPADLQGVLLRDSMRRFPLDGAGAVELVVVPGRWVILVAHGDSYVATVVEAEAAEQDVDLALQAMSTMRVTLRDELGRPVAGARVEARGSNTRASNDPLQAIRQGLTAAFLQRWPLLRTDADGAVTIPFVPVDGVTRRAALVWQGGSTAEFGVEVGPAPLLLRPK